MVADARFKISTDNQTAAAFRQIQSDLESTVRIAARVGAGVGVVAAAVAATIGAAARAQEDVNKRLLQTEAILRTTGNASGLTVKQIDDLSRSIANSTLATSDAVREASNVLLTFRSISGNTFRQTLMVAQDLSSVFGNDLKSATVQLGKALEDPIQGVSALREVGVSFTKDQQEMIKSMVEAGDKAKAQQLILAELERQVGGAGKAQGAGLDGSINRLKESWSLLLEEMGKSISASQNVSRMFDQMARGADNIRKKLFPSDEELAASLFLRVQKLQGELQEAFNSGAGPSRKALLVAELEQAQGLLKATTERVKLNAQAAKLQESEAKSGQVAAEKEREKADQTARRVALADQLIKQALAEDAAAAKRRDMIGGKVGGIEETLMSEEERLAESYRRRQAILDEALSNQQVSHEHHADLIQKLEAQHAKKIELIERAKAQAKLDAAATAFANVATLMSSENRKQFELGKAAAIAETIISTYTAAQLQFENVSKITTNPYAAYAAAAAAVVAGLARVQAIQNTSFGGGGSGGIGNTGSGVSTAQDPVGPAPTLPQNQATGTTNIIVIGNQRLGSDSIDETLLSAREALEGNDLVLIDPGSRNGQLLIDAAVAKAQAGSRT